MMGNVSGNTLIVFLIIVFAAVFAAVLQSNRRAKRIGRRTNLLFEAAGSPESMFLYPSDEGMPGWKFQSILFQLVCDGQLHVGEEGIVRNSKDSLVSLLEQATQAGHDYFDSFSNARALSQTVDESSFQTAIDELKKARGRLESLTSELEQFLPESPSLNGLSDALTYWPNDAVDYHRELLEKKASVAVAS